MPDILAPGGFQTDRFEETRAKFVVLWRNEFGPNANTASDTPDGHVMDWGTGMAQAVQEGQARSYQAQFLTTVLDVNGAAQIIGPLFGTFPKQSTGSTGLILAFGITGTSVGQGSVCSTSQGGDRFVTDQTLAIEQSIWIIFTFGQAIISSATQIKVGDFDYGLSFGIIGTGLEVAQTAAGTLSVDSRIAQIHSAYEDPNGQGILIVETRGILFGSVTATNSTSDLFRGSLMPVTSEVLGPIVAEALTLTRVDTPAPGDGWKGCANLSSVTVGSTADTLPQFIQRHLDTLGKNGTSSLVGLIGRLRDLDANPGNEYIEIYNNPLGTVDSADRPGHSFEVVYLGGVPETMALIVWENHPLGIQSVGTEIYNILDPRTNNPHTVFLTSATEFFAWVDVVITPGEGFPSIPVSNLQIQIANAIVALGQTRGVGVDAYLKDIAASMGLVGVESCVIEMAFTSSPGDPKPVLFAANIIVQDTHILRWDTVRVEVVINE